MIKDVKIPNWIPEAYIIDELLRGTNDLNELEIEVVYPMEDDPQPEVKKQEEERVIIIEL